MKTLFKGLLVLALILAVGSVAREWRTSDGRD